MGSRRRRVILTSICIGLLRGSYDVVTGDLLKLAGVRRRAILVGEGESLARLRRTARREPRRDRLPVHRGGRDLVRRRAACRCWGTSPSLPTVLAHARGRRADRDRLRLQRPGARRDRRAGAPARASRCASPRARPSCSSSGAASTCPGRAFRSSSCRPPVFAGADWVVKRGFDLVVSALIAVVRLAVLAADRTRDQARLARPRLLPRPARRPERAGVRHAQVPHDVRRRRGPAGGARGGERGRGRPLQDPRRPPRDAGRTACCGGSRSTRSRRC